MAVRDWTASVDCFIICTTFEWSAKFYWPSIPLYGTAVDMSRSRVDVSQRTVDPRKKKKNRKHFDAEQQVNFRVASFVSVGICEEQPTIYAGASVPPTCLHGGGQGVNRQQGNARLLVSLPQFSWWTSLLPLPSCDCSWLSAGWSNNHARQQEKKRGSH